MMSGGYFHSGHSWSECWDEPVPKFAWHNIKHLASSLDMPTLFSGRLAKQRCFSHMFWLFLPIQKCTSLKDSGFFDLAHQNVFDTIALSMR